MYIQARTAVSVRFAELVLTIVKNDQTRVNPVPQDGPPFNKEENIIGNVDIVRLSTFSMYLKFCHFCFTSRHNLMLMNVSIELFYIPSLFNISLPILKITLQFNISTFLYL